ncbi:MAG: hypothetical protein EOS11_16120 [Mesorhizobium sp.]|nr:MAG: hypothetical protein EOS10_16365 [Mesorhizobium sp.]RWO42095.1 MAG: hypothetical protein EOS11_16120 [Mesorhizobium sp.]TIN80156.1 MAG: hypothetical protein E5Y09_07190 [Mesorhizobium sp.]
MKDATRFSSCFMHVVIAKPLRTFARHALAKIERRPARVPPAFASLSSCQWHDEFAYANRPLTLARHTASSSPSRS